MRFIFIYFTWIVIWQLVFRLWPLESKYLPEWRLLFSRTLNRFLETNPWGNVNIVFLHFLSMRLRCFFFFLKHIEYNIFNGCILIDLAFTWKKLHLNFQMNSVQNTMICHHFQIKTIIILTNDFATQWQKAYGYFYWISINLWNYFFPNSKHLATFNNK